jgi:hypothetical protein
MKYLLLLLLIFFSAGPLPSWGARIRCADTGVTVVAEKRGDLEGVCGAVQNGAVFLQSIGLKLSPGLVIKICKRLTSNGYHNAIGQYDSHSDEISVLDHQTALKDSRTSAPAFGVTRNRIIWRSYIVHELAHAAAQRKFAPGMPTHTASEYIACVTQLATLPPKERQTILRNYSESTGFDHQEQITMSYYQLDPCRFSVNAYLHFSKPENGPRFVKRLLQQGLPDD